MEMTAIWLRLQENYGYKGGYSSIRRFVHRLEPVYFKRGRIALLEALKL